jgi:hypothetical protein
MTIGDSGGRHELAADGPLVEMDMLRENYVSQVSGKDM